MSLRATLLLALTGLAATTSTVLKESRSAPPAGFVSQGMTPGDQSITLRVGLTANNLSGLQEKLASISTPGSAEFRQWLTMEEVTRSRPYSVSWDATCLKV